MLHVNQVLKLGERRLRVLWSDSVLGFWIDIDDPKAVPESFLIHDFEDLFLDGEMVITDDPFVSQRLREPEKGSVQERKRDQAWSIVGDLISDPELYERSKRGRMVSRAVEVHGTTKQTVYRLLRRYWQRGMSKNALLPDYFRSGAKGQRRRPNKVKLGRPREIRDGVGGNVTPEIERVFRRVIEREVLVEKGITLADAHVRTLDLIRLYNPGKPADEMPTVEQFRYFYSREYKDTDAIRRLFSAVEYAKDIRPLKGTSTTESLGPGYRYQIDATVADIYLVSDFDRSLIVGRPVIYMVIDVFSRMVVGLYVGFEGPSWVSAMMALEHAISDKVSYCRQFGCEITEADWPARGLPDVILADKGELNGTKVETFASAFGVRIENAPARRGDAKGIVERHFRTIQEKFKPYNAGVVEPVTSLKRGGRDYRLEANLTMFDFTRQIISSILWHNNSHVLSKYDRTEGMPSDLPAVPVQLWNWGVSNLTGLLRQAPEDLVRINLLPHNRATVSEVGIRLFGCFYSCPEAVKLGWFHRGGQGNRPQHVQVAYDPRCADQIYLRPSNELSEYWVCGLIDKSRRFRGKTFWDVWRILKAERRADANAGMEAAVTKGALIKNLSAISDEAERQRPTRKGLNKKDLGKQVRENKEFEKAEERARSVYKPKARKRKAAGEVVPITGSKPDDFAYPDYSDLLFGDDDDAKR